MSFGIKLGGVFIEIEGVSRQLEKFCEAYCFKTVPDNEKIMRIRLSQEDLRNEKQFAAGTDGLSAAILKDETAWTERQALLRKIAERIPGYGALLIHGAAVSYKGKGLIFTAPSGTGKSTHIRLWRKLLGRTVEIINGDKPFLSVRPGEQIRVCGSPWAGKEGWQDNRCAPVSGICFLKQSRENRIRRLTAEESTEQFLKQIYLPSGSKEIICTLEMTDRILEEIPLWMLECTVSEDAVKCSFESMTGEKFEVRTSED